MTCAAAFFRLVSRAMGSPRTFNVRVIAGDLKGRRLRYPARDNLRPTMQRTKSSIFGTLAPRIRGTVFVDLFCGAGSMGIEALSRGARFVHFVESDRTSLDFLERNLETCGIGSERRRVHRGDVYRLLRDGGLADAAADVVHVDPPYEDTDFVVLLELVEEIGYSHDGVIVIEHPTGSSLKTNHELLKSKTFGQTTVSFLRVGTQS